MILITREHGPFRGLLDLEIDRLVRLTADLMAVRHSRGPTKSDLEDTPILGNWERGTRSVACLIGNVCDHPMLPGKERLVATSDLWILAPDQGWARTMSRWYRLGRPREASLIS
ncbi:DUF6634 family protein [Microvirga tunisiensis]|uniref:Uncharacterized protein n=1 Tax=Microvirga tunisiensis TaxID=2108360 RepID=A0A5N7MZT2_9HYPH|nr:DUF6634 family protein [Microvirga tunisiensis]MPR11365.1 hypothetical protein [Microvirga tunisiensis]MPR29406.1 hypothetical protein [Microvirga tunisiensis]